MKHKIIQLRTFDSLSMKLFRSSQFFSENNILRTERTVQSVQNFHQKYDSTI
jgi:hypothetical protein